jgi:hypothetical protein
MVWIFPRIADKSYSIQNVGVKDIGNIQCVDELQVTSSSLGSNILSVIYVQEP